jgi:hypothetical protein
MAERIWVPGRLWVTSDDELRAGPSAGLTSSGRALAKSPLGRAQQLGDLRHTLWLVERAQLEPSVIDDQALVLPEKLVDRERQPHAHRWLARLPLLCVSGLKHARLVDHGKLRVYKVAVDERRGKLTIAVEAAGAGRPAWSFEGLLPALERAAAAAGPTARALHPAPSFADRLLRELTRGVLDESAVVAAWQAAELCEPGYGYRGATDGSPASLEEVEAGVRALEAVFAQIDERARAQDEAAREIATALRQADADHVAIPVYGEADRFIEEEVRIELVAGEGRHQVGDETRSELVLPSYPRWFVSGVEPWEPTLPPAIEAELEKRRSATVPSQWLVVALLALLAVIAAISFMLRGD